MIVPIGCGELQSRALRPLGISRLVYFFAHQNGARHPYTSTQRLEPHRERLRCLIILSNVREKAVRRNRCLGRLIHNGIQRHFCRAKG